MISHGSDITMTSAQHGEVSRRREAEDSQRGNAKAGREGNPNTQPPDTSSRNDDINLNSITTETQPSAEPTHHPLFFYTLRSTYLRTSISVKSTREHEDERVKFSPRSWSPRWGSWTISRASASSPSAAAPPFYHHKEESVEHHGYEQV